jgi:hypothetical protein
LMSVEDPSPILFALSVTVILEGYLRFLFYRSFGDTLETGAGGSNRSSGTVARSSNSHRRVQESSGDSRRELGK